MLETIREYAAERLEASGEGDERSAGTRSTSSVWQKRRGRRP